MRHSKRFILIAALLAAVVLAAAALAEGTLSGLWNSGRDFLFHTDNVTVEGEAVFALDGEVFKTAKLHYVQDGCASYYGLELRTPWTDGDRETGWTIIADEEGYVTVMEAYYPGTYKSAHTTPHNTLLRRSVELDALTELGGLVAGQVEGLLPEGVVTETEENGVREVRIHLAEGQVPELAASALNVAAGYLVDRWFSFGHDRNQVQEGAPFENYVTVTGALTDGTVRWTLREADVYFMTDDQSRLTGVQGMVKVTSTFWDGKERVVEVRFDMTAGQYGTSRMTPFSADDYGVVPWDTVYGDMWVSQYGEEMPDIELDDAAWEAMKNRALSILEGQGYATVENPEWGGWINWDQIMLGIYEPDNEYAFRFTEDGSLVSMERLDADWLFADEQDAEGYDAEALSKADAFLRGFVADVYPALAEKIGTLAPQCVMYTEGSVYATFYDEEKTQTFFVVRLEPTLRVEYFEAGAADG